jgi:DNA-binding MarR family transcriptional regulator
MRSIELPIDYALVLQQVHADGEEDFGNLAETLSYDRRRLSHIVHALQNKGLVTVSWKRSDGWISLSARGRRLVETLWSPNSMKLHYR